MPPRVSAVAFPPSTRDPFPGTGSDELSETGAELPSAGPTELPDEAPLSRRAPVVPVDRLTLVIPSHNEAPSLAAVLRECWADRPRGVDLRFLVVDDASTDSTPAVLRALQAELPIQVVRNPKSLGFGGSLKVGIAHTETPWVAFNDADGQYDPRDLPMLLAALESGNDLALGLRTRRADPFVRIAISVGFRAVLFLLFAHAPRDPTTSLKAGRTAEIRQVAARTRYMNGSFWNEFMVRWRADGYSFLEVPVHHRPRLVGTSKVAAGSLLSKLATQQFIALVRVWREFHSPTRALAARAIAEHPDAE